MTIISHGCRLLTFLVIVTMIPCECENFSRSLQNLKMKEEVNYHLESDITPK